MMIPVAQKEPSYGNLSVEMTQNDKRFYKTS
ncbi:hypothetical protein FHS10_004198 [Mucilaginibacter dorajii]|nr:hypothetical protein [Mucilaginibacter dorajii]